MTELTECIPCQHGDHDHHIEVIEAVPEGMIGGAQCPCAGECRERPRRPVVFAAPKTAPREGVVFYTRPEDLVPEQIDPLLRDAVVRINASGWVWTGESCQGHPDAASPSDTAWTHNTEPYLRLICARRDLGRMLAALVESTEPTVEDQDAGTFSAPQLRLFRSGSHEEWAEVMVYVLARNVMERDFGCRVFERFAASVTPVVVCWPDGISGVPPLSECRECGAATGSAHDLGCSVQRRYGRGMIVTSDDVAPLSENQRSGS